MDRTAEEREQEIKDMQEVFRKEAQFDERAQEQQFQHLRRGPSYSDPMIVVDLNVYRKIMYWVQAAPGEVSWMGRAVPTIRSINGVRSNAEVTDWHIVEVRILPQRCNAGFTEISEETMSKFVVELARKGKNPAEWNHWGHSHSDFGVFMSGIDDDAAHKLSRVNPCISVVFNRYGQMHGRMDHEFVSQELCVAVRPLDIDSNLRLKANGEVNEMVKEFVYVKPRKTKGFDRFEEVGGVLRLVNRRRSRRELRRLDHLQDGSWLD